MRLCIRVPTLLGLWHLLVGAGVFMGSFFYLLFEDGLTPSSFKLQLTPFLYIHTKNFESNRYLKKITLFLFNLIVENGSKVSILYNLPPRRRSATFYYSFFFFLNTSMYIGRAELEIDDRQPEDLQIIFRC